MANRIIENKPGKRAKTNDENVEKKETVKKSTPGKNKKKEKKPLTKNQKIVLGVVAGILGIILILAIIFVVKLAKNDWDFGQTLTNDVLGPKDPIFVLAMGVSEDIEVPLTDTMMVLGYNPTDQKAFAISIPRDTFIGNDYYNAGGYDKLNSLYQKSPEKTKQAIEKILGIDIDHYVVVQNKVVRDVVDALGAVEFNVPIDMDYDDDTQNLHIHLKAGVQSMNGEQVEQLLRFRHNNDGTSYPSSYGDNDFGRMRTQREFVKELLKQCMRFKNVGKIIDLTTAFFDNVDTDMSLAKAVSYVPYALQFNPDELISKQVPGAANTFNSLSFYEYSKSSTKVLMATLLHDIGLYDEEKDYRKEHKLKADEFYTSNSFYVPSGTPPTYNETGKPVEEEEDYIFTNLIDDHIHQYTIEKERKESTCKEQGYIIWSCNVKDCKKTQKDTLALSTKHIEGKPDANGKVICTVCEKVIKTGNSNGDTTTNSVGNTVGNTTGNTVDNNTVDTQQPAECKHEYKLVNDTSTCLVIGEQTYKCKNCESSYKQAATKTKAHTFVETSETCTTTGCTEKNPNYKAPVENPTPEGDGGGEQGGDVPVENPPLEQQPPADALTGQEPQV